MRGCDISEILEKAYKILLRYPLCDKCLGRLFAHYAIGLSNEERGRAIKTLLAMKLHKEVNSSERQLRELEILAKNAGYPLTTLYTSITGKYLEVSKCYVCNNMLSTLIPKLIREVVKQLSNVYVKSFIVAVKSGSDIELRERKIAEEFNLEGWESIRREVKREVGKAVSRITGLKPDFSNPDAIALLDLNTGNAELILPPLYLKGRYHKLGRYISQMAWIGRDGSKKYKLSIEEVCQNVVKVVNGEEVKIHAAGREDVDARMLGRGRPLIIEVKKPRVKVFEIPKVNNALRVSDVVNVRIESVACPASVTKIKEEVHQKVYGVVVYSDEGITNEDVRKVEESFKNTVVRQLTPRRVLRRRKELVRTRKVYEVRGLKLDDYLAYFIIRCDGGLYVKELVNGDEGRTEPSFASVTNKRVEVLFLDVLEYLD